MPAEDAVSGPGPRAILGFMNGTPQRPQVGVGVVFIRDGRVLLARRQKSHGEGEWASAGGHLELGESLEECARREALEELGLVVGELSFLCVSNIVAYGKHYVDVEFLGDIGVQEPRPTAESGLSELTWFLLDGLPEPLFRPMEYALDSLRTGRRYYSGPECPRTDGEAR